MTLVELVERDTTLKRVANTNGGEWAGPCPWCHGTDRFRAWKQRYWCRQCGRRGDAIAYLRDFHGLSFRDACRAIGRELLPLHSPAYRQRHAHQRALAAAKAAFEHWAHDRFIRLTDQYRELLAEQETAAIAHRFRHALTAEQVDYWQRRQTQIGHELESIERELNLFTYHRHALERLHIWKERYRWPSQNS